MSDRNNILLDMALSMVRKGDKEFILMAVQRKRGSG